MPSDHGLAWAESTRKDEPPEEKPKLSCDSCGQSVFEGEQYFTIGGRDYCQQCVEDRYGRYA